MSKPKQTNCLRPTFAIAPYAMVPTDFVEQWDHLMRRCREAHCHAVMAGFQPTDLWLGPEEARVFEVGLNWKCIFGHMPSSKNMKAMISGDLEGVEFQGMVIRLSVHNGVRVGASWPKEESQPGEAIADSSPLDVANEETKEIL